MADKDNLFPGDSVNWIRDNEIVPATVQSFGAKLVTIKIERDGKFFLKNVDAKNLRLVYGGRQRQFEQRREWSSPWHKL